MRQTTMSGIHQLEVECWAPWLRFSPEELEGFQRAFPEGQITRPGPDGRPWGALTSVRVRWSGDPSDLGTWDALAGRVGPGEVPHDPSGNALALLSTSVHPTARGHGVGRDLIGAAVAWARDAGLDHVIGPFRPSGFGAHKAATGDLDPVPYCAARRADGTPVDPWLRSLAGMGMVPLKVVDGAMVVVLALDEVAALRTSHRPELWWTVLDARSVADLVGRHRHLGLGDVDEVWECGETGSWLVERTAGIATYVEPNLWGCIPLGQA